MTFRPDRDTRSLRTATPRYGSLVARRLTGWLQPGDTWRDAALAALTLAVTTGIMLLLRHHLNVLNISLLYLIVVTGITLFAGRWVSVAAAFTAFLLFDFVFILPFYTFTVAEPDHALALFVFLGVATLISQLIARVRQRTIEALERGRRMETLYALSQALIADTTVDSMLATIVNRVVDVMEIGDCAILMPVAAGELSVRVSRGDAPRQDDREHAGMLAWVWEHRRQAILGPPTGRVHLPRGERTPAGATRRIQRERTALYVPIVFGGEAIGILYVARPAQGRRFNAEDERLLNAFSNHAALALERTRLTEEATRAAVLARSDELKSALLSAVSHDLRTPLASIKASATSLLQDDISWSPSDQRDLLQAIDEETDRLTRIVSNLLDLSRIEAGKLRPALAWNDVEEVVRETVERITPALGDHPVRVFVAAVIPPVLLDYVEISQVLVNLLENAAKYSPASAPIEVTAECAGACVTISVADRGTGVPVGQEAHIFKKFQRLDMHRTIPGAGIGLSISKGIVEAHGGTIGLEARPGGGTLFAFSLPIRGPAKEPN